MRIKFNFILFLFLFGCSVEVKNSNIGKTDQIINEFLNTKDLPGISVSVMKEGKMVYSKGFGYADVDSKTLIMPSKTKFRIGSVSKTLTASALMILVEKEQIDLDKSIYSYTPEFPQKKWDFNLRMMTRHLSGIRHYKNDEMNITKNYDKFILNVAVAYGGREEVVEAFRNYLISQNEKNKPSGDLIEEIDVTSITEHLYTSDLPDPDLIIRTSGEIRLSGFLMWQSVYAEYYFCDTFWPAFRKIDFLRAIRDYNKRQRRFGR